MPQSNNKKNILSKLLSRRQENKRSVARPSTPVHYDALEQRQLLAFVAFGDMTTLMLTQTGDDGNVIIDNDGTGGAFRVTDGVGTANYLASTNIIINLMDGTGNELDFNLGSAHTGNVEINLGNGTRDVDLAGLNNTIGGSLTINGGTGDQDVELSPFAELDVSGDLNLSLGLGTADIVTTLVNDLTVDGNLNFDGVNTFRGVSNVVVLGNATMDVTGDDEGGRFDDTIGGSIAISGAFTFTGDQYGDAVFLHDTFSAASVDIHLGDIASNRVDLPTANIAGDVTITGGSGIDVITSDAATMIGGDIDINLGDSSNDADILGVFGGTNVSYQGGNGVDTVVFGTTGTPAQVNIILGDDSDSFEVAAGAAIAPTTLTVDFGDDNDTFINNFGAFNFNANLMGLHGFDHAYEFSTDTLTSVQVSDPGSLLIDDLGTGGAIQFINGGTVELTPVTNLSVTLVDNLGTMLDVGLDLSGNLMLNLGEGARDVNFVGLDNTILGNLTINGGADTQTIELAVDNGLIVRGDATIDLGAGSDLIDEDARDLTFNGDVTLIGVNTFQNDGAIIVSGNLFVDSSSESEISMFSDGDNLAVQGNATFLGGDNQDSLTLGSNSLVAGNLLVNFGEGLNAAVLNATLGGTNSTYRGGTGVDAVTYDMPGTPAFVNMVLGTGDDMFELGPNASIAPTTLRVDFGGGVDGFVNNYGDFTFNAAFLNWDNFNRFYSFANDNWNIVQLGDDGTVSLDNNGPGNALQLFNTYSTEMTASDNARLNMMPDTGAVVVDFDNPHAGYLILNLNNGSRFIDFTGDSNSIGGFLSIEAGSGDQDILMASTSDFNSNGDVTINLREGHDQIYDNGRSIFIGGTFILRGVNQFQVTHSLDVGNNMTMNTTFEDAAAKLDNDGLMTIDGNLTYLGGVNVDNVVLNDGVYITGNAYIDVGAGSGTFPGQSVILTEGFSAARATILGGNSAGGNSVITDASTYIENEFVVDFSSTTTRNLAVFKGTFDGTYASYRGGSGDDTVAMDALAANADFVMQLGAGEDLFNLDSDTTLMSMFVNFGDDTDTFEDEFAGTYPFTAEIVNLP